MVIFIAIMVGLVLGSFLSVVLERLGRRDGIIAGRSECPHCQHLLAWYDLIPLVSYVLLGGRCRYCHASISAQYPMLEVAMAFVFGGYAFQYGVTGVASLVDLLILFGLVALFFFDLRYQILPDVVTGLLIGLALVRLIFFAPGMLTHGIITALVLAGVLGLLYMISQGRWLGFGDVKLAVLVGLLFGYPSAIGVTLLAIWAGALVGIGLMLAGRANRQTALPFGSFWTAVAIVAIIWPASISYVSRIFIL